MWVSYGPHRHETDEFGPIMVDRPLDRSQVRLLCAAIAAAGLHPRLVQAVDLVEGECELLCTKVVDGRQVWWTVVLGSEGATTHQPRREHQHGTQEVRGAPGRPRSCSDHERW